MRNLMPEWQVRTVLDLALRRYLQNLLDFSLSKEHYQS
jgi:hypothetical protein